MRALVLILLVALAPAARAEDIVSYPVAGESDAGGSQPRIAALDEAFARAVDHALADVLETGTRKANQSVIDREIIGRARLWVARFTVTKDETVGGRRQLHVLVRVDRDKMRARLAELNIGTRAADEAAGGRPGVVLLAVQDGERVRATFGPTASQDVPGLAALAAQLRRAGITVKRAPARGTPQPGALPLDDASAAALATEGRAELAAIAGVAIGAPVPVRGVATSAALVTATVKVLERGKPAVGPSTAAVAARGTEPSLLAAAIDRALVAALADVLPPKRTIGPARGFEGDDTPVAEPGVVLVRLPPGTPFALVNAELRYLAGARGVSRAVLRRLSPGGWVIGVSTTASVQRIANIARRAPTADSSARVKVVGELVEVVLR